MEISVRYVARKRWGGTMRKTKPVIEVGQTVYVNVQFAFVNQAPKLSEYIVTKVNTKSFYASKKGLVLTNDYEVRFDKKTMQSCSFELTYKAYLTKEEYWDMIELGKERESLRKEIAQAINGLGIEKLREIKNLINT